jgi:hypothetical protein
MREPVKRQTITTLAKPSMAESRPNPIRAMEPATMRTALRDCRFACKGGSVGRHGAACAGRRKQRAARGSGPRLQPHVKALDAIAEVLGDATSESIAAEVGPAADATRSTVLLKMAVVRLEPIRTPDRIHVKKLVKAGAGLDQLLEVIREIASPDELEQRVREAWTDASAVLDREWDRRKLELAPGEEVLDTI